MSYISDEDIMNRIKEHLDSALAAYNNPDWFVICLQGSQNYNLDDAESDIDTKLLILPTIEQLVFNRSAVSKVHVMENDEHCDVKDVREYFKLFRKQNINFVEILFTKYYIVNPKYEDLWSKLLEYRGAIAYYNKRTALKCMKGMIHEKRHALCHEYPSRMFMIEKYGFDPKQLSHIIRVYHCARLYIKNMPYEKVLRAHPSCLSAKRNKFGWDKDTAIEVADYYTEEADAMIDNYIHQNENNFIVNSDADMVLDDVLYTLITKSMKDSL